MSGSIGRSYLIQSWNDASSYSGEMIGNRQKESTELYLENGKANIAAFREDAAKTTKKPIPLRYKICPQQRTLDKLEATKQELNDEYAAHKLTASEYVELSNVLDRKIERAYELLAKAMQWKDVEDEEQLYCSLETQPLRISMVDQQLIENDNSVFMQLSVDNSIRRAYIAFRKIQNKFINWSV